MFLSQRFVPSRRAFRYSVVVAVAFSVGSASVALAVPTISGFVGLIDGTNTARINTAGELSTTDAGTHAALGQLQFDASGGLKVAPQGSQNVTGTVSVSNLPAVQNVSGTVSVDNLPAVQVATSAANPLSTRDVENPARSAVAARDQLTYGSGQNSAASTMYVVPAGKRLVLESLSVVYQLPAGQHAVGGFAMVVGGTNVSYTVPTTLQGTFGSTDYYVGGQLVRLYADPGTNVGFASSRDSATGSGVVFPTLFGYLVDVP